MKENHLSENEIQLLASVIAAKADPQSDLRQIAADVVASYEKSRDILKGYSHQDPSFDDYYHFPMKNV